jgi:hypothetical protein
MLAAALSEQHSSVAMSVVKPIASRSLVEESNFALAPMMVPGLYLAIARL